MNITQQRHDISFKYKLPVKYRLVDNANGIDRPILLNNDIRSCNRVLLEQVNKTSKRNPTGGLTNYLASISPTYKRERRVVSHYTPIHDSALRAEMSQIPQVLVTLIFGTLVEKIESINKEIGILSNKYRNGRISLEEQKRECDSLKKQKEYLATKKARPIVTKDAEQLYLEVTMEPVYNKNGTIKSYKYKRSRTLPINMNQYI